METVFDISADEIPLFLAETEDHLQTLEEGLVRIEQEDVDTDLIQALFRAAHTIKGMAGMIGHKRLTELTHALENVFDGVRKERVAISTPLVDACLSAVDGLRSLRDEVDGRSNRSLDVQTLIGALINLQEGPAKVEEKAKSTGPTLAQAKSDGGIHVEADILGNSVASAARAFQLMLAMQNAGEITAMSPSADQIDSAQPVKTFSGVVRLTQPLESLIHELLTISEIERLTVDGKVLFAPAAPAEKPTEPAAATASAPVQAETQPAAPQAQPAAPAATSAAQPEAQRPAAKQGANTASEAGKDRGGDKTIRTSVERLDNLMNLVGELITDRNRLYLMRHQLETSFKDQEMIGALGDVVLHIGRLTDQLQEEVMHIRMLPVANVFNKFPRMVRDLAQKTGKEIDLVMRGQETELDRSVIEQINDPLIHLIRNSVDHGIEKPANRIAAGKPAKGTVLLTAKHEQGHILLTVEDDGAGIDAEKLKASAIRKGLMTETEAAVVPSDRAVDLIFMPGLSTAEKVTDVSGRGVGMDIVRNNLERVNGTIAVETSVGKGTRFQVTLPLTLAIVPTLLVRVGNIPFAIPLVVVVETQRLLAKDIQSVGGRPTIILRDQILSLVSMNELFELPASTEKGGTHYLVVVRSGKLQVGLIVDRLIGEEEVVVKSLGPWVGDVSGISSAAILGDGQIALIADVQGILRLAGVHQNWGAN
jgi:two-component system, chemotaxis family, sensor kinase CheA